MTAIAGSMVPLATEKAACAVIEGDLAENVFSMRCILHWEKSSLFALFYATESRDWHEIGSPASCFASLGTKS